MNKIKMNNPIVEMDGDEMTRILWQKIKDELLLPYVELNTDYYDLSLLNRDKTDDQITKDAAAATKIHKVAVKCATITSNKQRMEEYHLTHLTPSPNATYRAALDGTVFRTPILIDSVKPAVRFWKKPITIARHAYGDIYKAVEIRTDKAGTATLSFTDESGNTESKTIMRLDGPAVLQGMHNKEVSIRNFAKSCFAYALSEKQDLWFSTKDTISKTYDGAFREIFDEVYEEYKEAFEKAGIKYFYTLIDDAVARVIRSEGGFIWACKNYDGDVMSDMVSTAFGSLSMMKSVLVSPDGCYEFEAAHGTVTRHYYRYLKGEKTSTNPIATLFAWTGALNKRGELDGNADLCKFAGNLEKAVFTTLDQGIMTKDLAHLASEERNDIQEVDTDNFIQAIKNNLESIL